jgi:hypothetical protein
LNLTWTGDRAPMSRSMRQIDPNGDRCSLMNLTSTAVGRSSINAKKTDAALRISFARRRLAFSA